MSSTWNLSTIYRQAFELTKKNRKLWILGLAVSVLVATGSSHNIDSSSSRKSDRSSSSSLTDTKDKTSGVEEFSYRFNSNVAMSLRKISPVTFAAIGLELLAIAIFFAIIGIAASAWARGALIYGSAQAVATNEVDLVEAGRIGRQTVKTIVKIDYLPWIKVFLIMLGTVVLVALTALLNLVFLAILITLPVFIFLVILSIRILIAQIWAYRAAVITRQPYPQVMETGKHIAAGHVGSMFLLGLVNTLINSVSGLLLMLPFGGVALLGFIPLIINFNTATLIAAAISVLVSITIAIPLLVLKGAIYNAFSYLTWHLSYKIFNASVKP